MKRRCETSSLECLDKCSIYLTTRKRCKHITSLPFVRQTLFVFSPFLRAASQPPFSPLPTLVPYDRHCNNQGMLNFLGYGTFYTDTMMAFYLRLVCFLRFTFLLRVFRFPPTLAFFATRKYFAPFPSVLSL